MGYPTVTGTKIVIRRGKGNSVWLGHRALLLDKECPGKASLTPGPQEGRALSGDPGKGHVAWGTAGAKA